MGPALSIQYCATSTSPSALYAQLSKSSTGAGRKDTNPWCALGCPKGLLTLAVLGLHFQEMDCLLERPLPLSPFLHRAETPEEHTPHSELHGAISSTSTALCLISHQSFLSKVPMASRAFLNLQAVPPVRSRIKAWCIGFLAPGIHSYPPLSILLYYLIVILHLVLLLIKCF